VITLNKLNLRNILILLSPIFINACSGSLDLKESIAFESTYAPDLSVTTLITNAKIIDGTGTDTFNGSICIDQGKIKKISSNNVINEKIEAVDINCTYTNKIDAKNRFVTPGIIDVHSHLGNYPSPSVSAHNDGNEITSPITSEVYAEHGVWPQDPGFDEALKGGVTTLHILPGSANLFGGRGVTLRNYPSRTVQGMKFPEAPYTLKMACGENPKRVYGERGGPGSRMGNFAGYRQNWIRAQEYQEKRNSNRSNTSRDLQLETLADVLDGKILVQMHCYRADEMAQILDLAKEFNYKVTTFHHAVEAYKIR
jgi:imidazolonepropionase-like amidohydrolase